MSLNNLTIIDHPLIQHKLAYLRDSQTTHLEFRRLVKEITGFMLYELLADFPLRDIEIETPLQKTTCSVLDREISIVLILRAALGMESGLVDLVPTARVGHIGLYRDEDTLEPVEYYVKLPESVAETTVVVCDPMLATGNSSSKALDLVKEHGVREIRFACLVAAPEGVRKLNENHPDVPIFAASLDDGLNEHGYILPGLGDAGDRLFGTK